MKYYIMTVKSQRDNFGSLYQFLTTTAIDNEISPVEFDSDEELDIYVEDMLNNGGYSKDDFVIIQIKDYDIKIDIVEKVEI